VNELNHVLKSAMKEKQDQGNPKSHQKFDDATTIQIAQLKH
jgi:hypothetical protein